MSGGVRTSVKGYLISVKRIPISAAESDTVNHEKNEIINGNCTASHCADEKEKPQDLLSLVEPSNGSMVAYGGYHGNGNSTDKIIKVPCLPMQIIWKGCQNSVYSSASTVKKKIVIKVQFCCEKRKTEAFKTAAGFKSVSNVSIEADKDQVVVIGVGIDSVCLAKSLRKKLCYAQILSVEEVKKKSEEEKKPKVETIPIEWISSYQYPAHCDGVDW